MRNHRLTALIFLLAFGVVLPGYATVLVSNVWNTGVRTYPAYNDTNSPYSEMGVDYNSSGDFESAWFNGGGGTMTSSTGHLVTTVTSSSSSWTTYFTTESSPVTLAGAGDELKITWVFTPSGVATSGTSQDFRLAVVDSPSAARLTSDGSPGSSTYAGYAMFMNMATTLGSSSSFQLMDRNAPGTSSAFLSSSGSWTGVANGAGKNVTGYASGTNYTFVMTFTRNASNGLDITATMTGTSFNNTDSATVSYSDSAPNTFTFDTFGVRPSDAVDSAASFDTTLFEVEFIPGATPPSVTTDPQDQTVLVGQNANFNVLASGTFPLGYQWYYNTNTVLTNQTGSTLTVTNAQLTDAGGYSVIVSNAYGLATSAVAQLTVNVPNQPSIITQPQDQNGFTRGKCHLHGHRRRQRTVELSVVFQHQHAVRQCHRSHFDHHQCSTDQRRHLLGHCQQPRRWHHEFQCHSDHQYQSRGAGLYFAARFAGGVVREHRQFYRPGRRYCAHQLPMEQGLDADSGRDFVHPDLDERADHRRWELHGHGFQRRQHRDQRARRY